MTAEKRPGVDEGDLLGRIRHALESDPRIIAAWLAGSRGRGTADHLSDIDIWLAVEDDAIGAINADPLAFVHAIAPTIMRISAPSIAPPGGAFLLSWLPVGEGFTQVDWYWAPASTASRSAQTRILFERRPFPISVPEPDPLDAGALTAEIDAAISDVLLLIAYAWKHARRDHPWQMLNSIRHTDEILSRLEWLIAYGHAPAFDDPTRSFLPQAVPLTRDDQRAACQKLLDTLASLAISANRAPEFRDALAALATTLSS